jgi:hypothetical protein
MRYFSAEYHRQLVRIALLAKDIRYDSIVGSHNRVLITKVYRQMLKDSSLARNKTYIYEKDFWDDSQIRLFFYGMGFNLNDEDSTISWDKDTIMK